MASNVYINGATVFVSEDRAAIQNQVDTAVGSQAAGSPPNWIELTRMDPNTWPYEASATARVVVRADQVDAVDDYL